MRPLSASSMMCSELQQIYLELSAPLETLRALLVNQETGLTSPPPVTQLSKTEIEATRASLQIPPGVGIFLPLGYSAATDNNDCFPT